MQSIGLCLAALIFGALPARADDPALHIFAAEFLEAVQARSFKTGVEFCGYFGVDQSGEYVGTKPQKGRDSSCVTRRWPPRIRIVASYHTHGIYDPNADNEIPSVLDVETDMEEGIDGYLATPGGRLWFIDGASGTARQICGRACLISDPGFLPEPHWPVPVWITLEDLRLRQGS